jgi:hypothetical protein
MLTNLPVRPSAQSTTASSVRIPAITLPLSDLADYPLASRLAYVSCQV